MLGEEVGLACKYGCGLVWMWIDGDFLFIGDFPEESCWPSINLSIFRSFSCSQRTSTKKAKVRGLAICI